LLKIQTQKQIHAERKEKRGEKSETNGRGKKLADHARYVKTGPSTMSKETRHDDV